MKVTKPMIQRATLVLQAAPGTESAQETAEAMLRAALNDPAEPAKPIDGQVCIDVVGGRTVIRG